MHAWNQSRRRLHSFAGDTTITKAAAISRVSSRKAGDTLFQEVRKLVNARVVEIEGITNSLLLWPTVH